MVAFPVTRRSAVEAARSGDAVERARGLNTVAQAYWRPVYSYLRLHWRKSHDEAADLTQELFADLVDHNTLARFDPQKARLRTWLRVCVDGLVANDHRAQTRQKRSPTVFDFAAARAAVERASPLSPEQEFEKEWARAVFSMALEALRVRCAATDKEPYYALLVAYELGDRPTYAALAERFSLALTDVTNHLAWARRELRAEVFQLLADLTRGEAELHEAARALLDPW